MSELSAWELVIALLAATVLGIILGASLANDHWKFELLKTGNAEYDKKTGKFKVIPHISATQAEVLK
jgi:hypothetical protein